MDALEVKKSLLRRMNGKMVSVDEMTDYILNNLPVKQIAETLSFMLFETEVVKPIAITQEEFEKHFRIRGITADNQVERRGRPRKVQVEEVPTLL